MIIYFSATGNTEFVAKEFAKALDDEILNFTDKVKKNDLSEIYSEKPFVICAPIYACEMPRIMRDMLKKTPLTGNKNVYFVFTSAGFMGAAGKLAHFLCIKKKLKYKGTADIQMPRNYVTDTHYGGVPEQSEVDEVIKAAPQKIQNAAEIIKNGGKLKSRYVTFAELAITMPVNWYYAKYLLKSDDFYTTESCIGCGLCEKVCSLNNISMQNKKPVWGNTCMHCMACISKCPKLAIEYGTITQGKNRYIYPKVLKTKE